MLPKMFTNEQSLVNMIDAFFNSEMFPTFYRSAQCGYSAVNIVENDKDVTLEVIVPGMKKEEISIDVNNDMLTISAEIKSQDEQNRNYLRREFKPVSFSRSFTLPDYLDVDKISATHENGILKVVIEKKEQAIKKGPRQIEIK